MDERVLKRAARYMGAALTEENRALLLAAQEKVQSRAEPLKAVRRVQFTDTEAGVLADGLLLPGQSIRRHLKHSQSGYLFAATLGSGVDELIRLESHLSLARGMAASAYASAYIEGYLDELCLSLRGSAGLTPRFSPGYGDLPLYVQPDFLLWVQARRIGLAVTPNFMMTPEKSVTAIVGQTADAKDNCQNNCGRCEQVSCPFREDIQ